MDDTNAQATLNEQIYQKCVEYLPKDVKILYISLGGSKGKKLDSPTSDYDVKILLLNSYENYLLQRIHEHLKVDTMLGDLTLEGQAIDITRAFNYATETNAFITELVRSPCVYNGDPELIKTIIQVTDGSYFHYMPLHALNGILLFYINKELKDKGEYRTKVKAKALAETIYITLQLRALMSGKRVTEFFTIDDVLPYAGKEEELFTSIVKLRREDKNAELDLTKELIELFENANKDSYEKVKIEKENLSKELKQKRHEMKEIGDKYLLAKIRALHKE